MLSLASPNGGGGGDVHDAFYNRQMRRKAAVVCCAAAGGAAALYLQREMSATCPFHSVFHSLLLSKTARNPPSQCSCPPHARLARPPPDGFFSPSSDGGGDLGLR